MHHLVIAQVEVEFALRVVLFACMIICGNCSVLIDSVVHFINDPIVCVLMTFLRFATTLHSCVKNDTESLGPGCTFRSVNSETTESGKIPRFLRSLH